MKAKRKLRVAVVMGGPSAEHDVSLETGKNVVANLDRRRYAVLPVVVSRRGRWPMSIDELKQNCDLVFISMHGEYGEDGTVQKLLEAHRIHYTGSGAAASALGMDKFASATRFSRAGLLVPQFRRATSATRARAAATALGLPMAVKPVDRGSSIGVSIVHKASELAVALKNARRCSNNVIVQEYIAGTELTCAVLEMRGKPKALPVIEIVPKANTFFDYRAKYESGGSDEIVPARIGAKTARAVQRAAIAAHRAIGCSGYSRTDFILATDGTLYVLEINTLPGLTQNSLLPKAAAAAGISFPKLLDTIIKNALTDTRS